LDDSLGSIRTDRSADLSCCKRSSHSNAGKRTLAVDAIGEKPPLTSLCSRARCSTRTALWSCSPFWQSNPCRCSCMRCAAGRGPIRSMSY